MTMMFKNRVTHVVVVVIPIVVNVMVEVIQIVTNVMVTEISIVIIVMAQVRMRKVILVVHVTARDVKLVEIAEGQVKTNVHGVAVQEKKHVVIVKDKEMWIKKIIMV